MVARRDPDPRKDETLAGDDRLIDRAFAEARAVGSGNGGRAAGPAPAPRFELPEDAVEGYRVVKEISRGGQGIVYQGIQTSTRQKVAVKVLREGPFAGERDRVRFEREVQILGRLNHPNIVTIRDTGVSSGIFFLIMDFIPGQALDVYTASGDRDLRSTLELFEKICSGVNAAHRHGIIHRDLKPSNILIDERGEPHVLDFGLAKQAGMSEPSASVGLTATGQFVGSLPWASPEQAEGRPDKIDVRTDVYSLGVVLYQMTTGRFPYDVVGNVLDVIETIQRTEPLAPRKISRTVDDEVETILLKCLRKERDRRYQTAGEVARDIRLYLAGEPIEAKRDSALYLLRKLMRRYWLPAGIAGAFLVLVTVGLVVSLFLWRSADVSREKAERLGTEARVAREAAEVEKIRLDRSLYFNRLLLAVQAISDNDVAQIKALLAECPEEYRGFEWHRMKWLSDRSLQTLTGHEGFVYAVAMSPNGQILASGGEDRVIRLWHARSGYELRTLTGHTEAVRSLAFGPDGKWLASGGADGRVRFWNVETGESLGAPIEFEAPVRALGVDPRGQFLAAGDESGTVRVFEAGDEPREISRAEVEGGVFSLAFHPTRDLLLAGGAGGRVVVLDADEGLELSRLAGHRSGVTSIAVHPGGSRLLTGSIDGTVKQWDLLTGSVEKTRPGVHGAWVYGVAYTGDGSRFLTAGSDFTIKVWEEGGSQSLRTLRGHEDRVYAFVVSPDGSRIASGSRDGTVRLWDPTRTDDAFVFRGHEAQVWTVAPSPDGKRLVSGGSDGCLRIWNASDPGEEPLVFRGHAAPVVWAGFSHDGRQVVSSSQDGSIRIWDAATGDPLRVLTGHGAMVHSVAFDPEGRRLVSAGRDGTVRIWEARTGAELAVLEGHDTPVLCAVFSPDGKTVASSGTDGTILLRDGETGELRHRVRAHESEVYSLCFRPDGQRIISAGVDSTLCVLSPEGAVLSTVRGHRGGVRTVAVSPDGRRLASGGWDATVRIWDLETGSLALVLRGHEKRIDSVAFTPDGLGLASAGLDGTVRLWQARDED